MFTAASTAARSSAPFTPDAQLWSRAHEASAAASRQDPSLAHPQITFAEGLHGFGSHRAFVLAELESSPGMQALVATDDLTVQISVIDAALAVSGYPLAEAQAAAGMTGEEVAVALVVVRPANGAMTVNLRAPIVIGLTSRRGVQVILEQDLPMFAAL